MYICYLDESGTVELGDSSKHFVLIGLAVPADTWKERDAQIDGIKGRYGLAFAEIHTAWMMRDLPEQRAVPGFAGLDWEARRKAVLGVRVLNLSRLRTNAQQRSMQLTYRKSAAYVHLTRDERVACIRELASLVGSWADARIFGDAHFKIHAGSKDSFDIAFEQVVTRFNTCLARKKNGPLGILVQDNNETMASRLTTLMRKYHRDGTVWAKIDKIVETPLFVDSELTSMVQLADICAYAVRRFFDNNESDLFDRIKPAIDNKSGRIVGLRHFTKKFRCTCTVCKDHNRR